VKDLINRVSTISTIDERTLMKLVTMQDWCISDIIREMIDNKENEETIFIGIGTIKITIDEDGVRYKFKPSQELEDNIINTLNGEKSVLEEALVESVKKKLLNIYKDYC
jgi:hypothetical protein